MVDRFKEISAQAVNALVLAVCFAGAALAQNYPVPPKDYFVDANGIDLVRRSFDNPRTLLEIGASEHGGMAYSLVGDFSNLTGVLDTDIDNTQTTIAIGPISRTFRRNGNGAYTPVRLDGSKLVRSGTIFTHTAPDGAVAVFDTKNAGQPGLPDMYIGRILSLTYPTGERWVWNWRVVPWSTSAAYVTVARIQSVTNNFGYQLKFDYASNATPPMGASNADFLRITRVTGLNNAVDACAPDADTCAYSQIWPSVSVAVSGSTATYTDSLGRATHYISTPNGSGYTLTINGPRPDDSPIVVDNLGATTTYNNGSGAWSYQTVSDDMFSSHTTITAPDGQITIAGWTVSNRWLTSLTDSLGNKTSYSYDVNGRVTRITQPEGNYTQYTRNVRGDVTEVREVAKAGSGLADAVTVIAYGNACTNTVLCGLPTAVTDRRGNVTDYTYDAVHGGMLTETRPSPTPGAARPQTRYQWEQRYAWYKQDASGDLRQAPSPVWVQVGSSQCMTGATC